MFFKRSQKHKQIMIQSPLEGEILPLESVPDPVFSQKMLGDGFAVNPANGTVVSPIDGQVMNVFPTKHAVSLRDTNGKEILIHVGLETVNLKGEGFTSFVTDGQKIRKGEKLLEVDFAAIKDKVPSIITTVVITNLNNHEKVVLDEQGALIVC
ncbi:PTS sugar transporter subunit IIA [Neobacillus sp. SAB-20_R2A]|uniref:PTS sugar transporter subunit IIA n=1 Tax=Neobacillus sp. SAB-20_R2A TaxID=3120519 RepID=UPI003C6E784A